MRQLHPQQPVVVIVGRPNVGKSTLFNRLVGKKVAIVEKTPGVTRDRLYKSCTWREKCFTLVDTGGLDFSSPQEISRAISRQVDLAIREADVLLFVVDARSGLNPADEEIADILRRTQKPVLLLANKVEKFNPPPPLHEFYSLGLGEPFPVSAAEGLNTGDMLDLLLDVLPFDGGGEAGEELKIAVVGRPNVGKSSLINSLLGEERVIVSAVPGTTRDAVDTPFTRAGKRYLLIDTAGVRKKSKINAATEHYGVLRTLKAIERCQVAFLVLDAIEGVTEQDKRIAGHILEKGKATVQVVNKWDLLQGEEKNFELFKEHLGYQLPFLGFAPSVNLSALTGWHLGQLMSQADKVEQEYLKRLPTSEVNRLVREAVLQNPPPAVKSKRLKISYATQVKSAPPTFVFFVNDPDLVHFSYRRYLENFIRAQHGFAGTPLVLLFKQKAMS